MVGRPFPSGDPRADRRAGFAETLARQGDASGAIEVLSGALELAPGWAAGWFRLGEYLEGAGRRDDAVAAWDRALAADPADPFGAGLKRDLALGGGVRESMPPAFVEQLFDEYAPRFDHSLRDRLDYRGPEIVMARLAAAGFARAGRALDLGCGTGLMGALLRPACDWLGGCDISGGMLTEARAKGIYDRLEKRDIGALEITDERFDLIVAADVFLYLGSLERIIAWCAGALTPGGHLAFTAERGHQPVELRPSRRFAHSPDYLRGLLASAGFSRIEIEGCVLRRDRGEPVDSLSVVAAAPASRLDREGDGLAEARA